MDAANEGSDGDGGSQSECDVSDGEYSDASWENQSDGFSASEGDADQGICHTLNNDIEAYKNRFAADAILVDELAGLGAVLSLRLSVQDLIDRRIAKAWGITVTTPVVIEWFTPSEYLDGTLSSEKEIDVYQPLEAGQPDVADSQCPVTALHKALCEGVDGEGVDGESSDIFDGGGQDAVQLIREGLEADATETLLPFLRDIGWSGGASGDFVSRERIPQLRTKMVQYMAKNARKQRSKACRQLKRILTSWLKDNYSNLSNLQVDECSASPDSAAGLGLSHAEALAELMELGFESAMVQKALAAAKGDKARASELLFDPERLAKLAADPGPAGSAAAAAADGGAGAGAAPVGAVGGDGGGGGHAAAASVEDATFPGGGGAEVEGAETEGGSRAQVKGGGGGGLRSRIRGWWGRAGAKDPPHKTGAPSQDRKRSRVEQQDATHAAHATPQLSNPLDNLFRNESSMEEHTDGPDLSHGFLVQTAAHFLHRIPTLADHCVICDTEHVFQSRGLMPTCCTKKTCTDLFSQHGVGKGAADTVAASTEVLDLLVSLSRASAGSAVADKAFVPYPKIQDPSNDKRFLFTPDRKDFAKINEVLNQFPTMQLLSEATSRRQVNKWPSGTAAARCTCELLHPCGWLSASCLFVHLSWMTVHNTQARGYVTVHVAPNVCRWELWSHQRRCPSCRGSSTATPPTSKNSPSTATSKAWAPSTNTTCSARPRNGSGCSRPPSACTAPSSLFTAVRCSTGTQSCAPAC